MKIELDMDELVGVLLERESFYQSVKELHPEFMSVLYKRVRFLRDIQKAGQTIQEENTND